MARLGPVGCMTRPVGLAGEKVGVAGLVGKGDVADKADPPPGPAAAAAAADASLEGGGGGASRRVFCCTTVASGTSSLSCLSGIAPGEETAGTGALACGEADPVPLRPRAVARRLMPDPPGPAASPPVGEPSEFFMLSSAASRSASVSCGRTGDDAPGRSGAIDSLGIERL